VALLHDVEQTDLNFTGKIRKLIDREDPAVRPGQQAIVDAQIAADGVAAFRRFDRIDVADNVGNRHVGGGQFFDVTLLTAPILDRRSVALFLDQIPAPAADRTERIVVDFTSGDDWYRLV